MLTKLGFNLYNLWHHQLAYTIISDINRYYDEGGKADITLFNDNPAPFIVRPKCAVMHNIEIFEYEGTTVATNLEQALRLIKTIGPRKKIFYIHDLEWVHLPQKQYEELEFVYRHKDLHLYTVSQNFKEEIENAWNVRVEKVIEQFTVESFL